VKLTRASILMAVSLRLLCFHARAAGITWNHVNGGNGTVTMTWNDRRLPASNPVIAADASNQVVPNPGVSLDACGRWAVERCNPGFMPAGTGLVDAAAWQLGLKTGIGDSPPASNAPGRDKMPAFSCGTLVEDGYQIQSSARLAQSGSIKLGGNFNEADAALSVSASAGFHPPYSSFVLIL